MSTKITRKDAEKILFDLSKSILSTIMESGCVVADQFMTSHSYVDKGKSMEEFFCRACGSTHNNISAYGYYGGRYSNRSATCPTCGNTNYTSQRHHRASAYQMFVQELSDGFQFALYNKEHKFPDLIDDWYMHQPEVSAHVSYVGRFDKENGWYVFDVNDNRILSRNSIAEQDVLKCVKGLLPINEIEGDFATMLAEASVYEAQKAAKNAAKKAASKTTLLEEMRQAYKAKYVDPDVIAHHTDHIFYQLYSTKNKKAVYMACCTNCGHVFETEEYEIGTCVKMTCPSCGFEGDEIEVSSYRNYSGNCYEYFAFYENTNLPENDLLIRVFKVDKSFSSSNGFHTQVVEKQRIFCGKKMHVYVKPSHYSHGKTVYSTGFEKATIRDVSNSLVGWRTDACVIQSEEEIAQIIRNSCLMYSGLVENYGLGDKRYSGYEKAPRLEYLMTWYKKPAIEFVLKANMTSALEHLISYPEHICVGKTLAEALGVHPTVAKIAAKLNLSYSQVQELSALYNADNTITADSYLEIVRLDVPIGSVAMLKSQFNVDYKHVIKYLDSVYNNQCIERREAIVQWLDYLRMATALRIDLTDKTRMYPGSLKKEHDVASFAYKAIQIEVDKERFAVQAEENAFYEYSYKDLIVIVPKTPQDIVEEATRQRNCLRSYVERVKNGDTVVAFVRRKIMPNATYVTAEIHNGELIQLKGYCNSDPRNKELVEFVQHWAKAKSIVVKC